jgi:hypothetical protein
MVEQQRVPPCSLSTALALALWAYAHAINSQLGFTKDYQPA